MILSEKREKYENQKSTKKYGIQRFIITFVLKLCN